MSVPKVLIIEDSRAVRGELARRVEVDLGFEPVLASNLAEAMEALEGGGLFVAVADLALPDSPSGEVVDDVLRYGVPCLVFTSDITRTTRDRILSKDVVDYVVKNRHAVPNLIAAIDRLYRNKGKKALVVDDSRSMRQHLKHLLTLQLFDVLEAESGEQALELLKEFPDTVLTVTDYEMEGMDGVELMVKLRNRVELEDMAVMGVSSYGSEPLSVRFIKNGANDFLKKPFEREEFLTRIAQMVDSMDRRRKLRELDELKNRLLGMAVHDLRNPINAVNGFSRLLLNSTGDSISADHRKMLQFIQLSSEQMTAFVNDLLDISVIESGRLDLDLANYDMTRLVEERLEAARLMAQDKGIVIESSGSGSLMLDMDRRRLGQVVDNLLSNAVKFSERGSSITVKHWAEKGWAAISVADEGPGISPEEQDKLFLSFQKLSNRPTAGEVSTGLGLAIVKKIVEAHQGHIEVESHPGKGSTFSVFLPVKNGA